MDVFNKFIWLYSSITYVPGGTVGQIIVINY